MTNVIGAAHDGIVNVQMSKESLAGDSSQPMPTQEDPKKNHSINVNPKNSSSCSFSPEPSTSKSDPMSTDEIEAPISTVWWVGKQKGFDWFEFNLFYFFIIGPDECYRGLQNITS